MQSFNHYSLSTEKSKSQEGEESHKFHASVKARQHLGLGVFAHKTCTLAFCASLPLITLC